MVKGVSIVEQEMKRLSLVTHAGTLTKESKTKYLFISSISCAKQIINKCIKHRALPMSTLCVMLTSIEETERKTRQLTEDKKYKILFNKYNHLPETCPF